jgi:enterobacterial common antigen flippase
MTPSSIQAERKDEHPRPRPGSILATFGASAVILGAGIGTGLLSSRILGPQGKGELTAVIVWATTITYLGSLGIYEATAYFAAKERQKLRTVFATSQYLAIGLGLIVSIIGYVALSGVFAGRGATLELSRRYLILFVVPAFVSLCSVAFLQGSSQWRWFNVSRSAVAIVTLIGMAAFCLAGAASVRTFLTASLIGNVTTPACALWAIATNRGWSWRPSRLMARAIVNYGIRVQFGTLSAMANARVDQLLLAVFFPAATLGLYAVAVTYVTVVNIVPATFAQLALPALVTSHEHGTAPQVLARIFRWNLWITGCATVVLGLASRWFVPWLFGQQFAPAVPMVNILALAAPVFASNMVLSAGFKACGQPGIASQGEAVGLVATVALLAVLLPRWAGIGAAVASVCSYSVTSAFLIWKGYRDLKIVPAHLVTPQADDWQVAHTVFAKLTGRRKAGAYVPS